MKQFITILTSTFLLFSTVQAQTNYDPAIAQAQKIVKDVMRDANLPGVAVTVSVEGNMIWSEGFGFADIENKIPVSPSESKFRIGSVSKPLTAIGLAMLYEKGLVNLDTTIQTYVTDFPVKKWDISLRQLAGHTAGIRHYQGNEFMSSKKYETVKEGLTFFKNDPLKFEPETNYSYSSYGWNLISAAMVEIAKEPFLDYMEKAIFKPMNLKNTVADHADQDIPNRTKFYQLDGRKAIEAPYVDNSYKWAGGGFLSTAEDLITFGNNLLYGKNLEGKTLKTFLLPQKLKNGKTTNYGMGFRTNQDKKGRVWFGHSGGSVGGTTMWMIFPDQELVIAVITNVGSANWKDLAFRVSNQFME